MRTVSAIVLLLGVVVRMGIGQPVPPTAANSPSAAATTPTVNDESYIIGREDALSVIVWKEPDLSGGVPVRPDGKISLPLVNDIQAAGLTPMQLASHITEALKKFLEAPLVTVTVTAMNSRHIYLTGQIGRSGSMPLSKDMTVMEALASAGCCLEFANTKKIYVLRNEGDKTVRYPFNYKEALKGRGNAQNIALKPGDTIVVP
ncbi:sugar transporter [Acidobacteria bacterium AB60]|nr:sugar transporter [Acidobacteria bacterium AB60]